MMGCIGVPLPSCENSINNIDNHIWGFMVVHMSNMFEINISISHYYYI